MPKNATPTPPPVDGLTYEQARDELVAVVAKLEAGGETLEASLALWERGEALAARCLEWLDGARARLDAARPDAARPDAARPDAARPDAARPEAVDSHRTDQGQGQAQPRSRPASREQATGRDDDHSDEGSHGSHRGDA